MAGSTVGVSDSSPSPMRDDDTALVKAVYETLPYPFCIIEVRNHKIVMANASGKTLIGKRKPFCFSVFRGLKKKCNNQKYNCPIKEVTRTGKPLVTEHVHSSNGKHPRYYEWHCFPLFNSNGKSDRVILFMQDITTYKMSDQAMRITNGLLRRERSTLKRKNLMQQISIVRLEQERILLQRQVQSNIDNVAMPALRALESRVDDDIREYVMSLKSVLIDIGLPFISDLEASFPELTPREIETCSLIKYGLSSKEIASAQGLSPQTVHLRRKFIRRKLGLANKRVNLHSFLNNL